MPRSVDRFLVSAEWPRHPDPEVRKRAVQALLTNHTLVVGQSRSGKTSAARRMIEEILLWTDTRLVLLDPNADFRWLNEVDLKVADKRFPSLWRNLQPRIRIASPSGAQPWGILWGQLSLEEMAAFLKLTPKDTFAEYQHFLHHWDFARETFLKRARNHAHMTFQQFRESQYFGIAAGEALERYRLLLQELAARKVWATVPRSDLDSLIAERSRAVVLDLSIDDDEVRTMSAARALQVLWRMGETARTRALQAKRRTRWVGTLVVIDEAHIFAPAKTTNLQQQLVSERIQRLADQGKKFNLYLLLITQQPDKLNQRILAECGNRVVLRMNERISLRVLEDTYGGLRGRYDGTLTFSPGEALIEGALLCDEDPPSPVPRGIQFQRPRTREGGGNPDARWALPKSV